MPYTNHRFYAPTRSPTLIGGTCTNRGSIASWAVLAQPCVTAGRSPLSLLPDRIMDLETNQQIRAMADTNTKPGGVPVTAKLDPKKPDLNSLENLREIIGQDPIDALIANNYLFVLEIQRYASDLL